MDLDTTTTPRIWIGCLAAYNEGSLHGEWVDATSDVEEMEEARARVLAASPAPNAEEAFIADHEGFPADTVGEYSSMAEIAELMETLEQLEDYPTEAVAGFIANGMDLDADAFQEAYAGEWDSVGDYAADFHEQIGTEIPEALTYYIDWEQMGRDMEPNGEIWTADNGTGGVYVFRNV